MKKRVVKPVVEKILTTVVIFQLIALCSLADFELSAIPLLIAFAALLVFNIKILEKYSKNRLTEDENVL